MSDGGIEGVAPYPDIHVADVGLMRFLDLRGLPEAALRGLDAVKYAGDLIATEEPLATYVWIVPGAIAGLWASFDPELRVLLAAHMRGAHREPGPDLVLAPGHTWSPAEDAALRGFGLVPTRQATVIGTERIITDGEILAGFDQPRPVGPARPVLDAVHHGRPLWSVRVHDIAVTEIAHYGFLDLRPASLDALGDGRAFYDVEHAIERLGRAVTTVVWIVAPWLLARWAPDWPMVLARLRGLMALRPRARHALAVYGDGADPAHIDALRDLGMEPLGEALRVVRGGTAFVIPPLTALRDAVMWRAAVERRIVTG
jgi:hypothetical protein